MAEDLTVRKTYKMFVDGAFIRSESGRAIAVDGVNVPHGSRKDLRDAVTAARTAFKGWSSKTAYNRGQILYRLAEMLDARQSEFSPLLNSGTAAEKELQACIGTLIWYAGWCDKIHQVSGTVNPVAAPYFVFTLPEPTGVIGLIAPRQPALLAAIRRIAPAIAGGNTAVVIVDEEQALPMLTFAEILATSDVPKGVVNIISGKRSELLGWLASHMDVNAVELGDCDDAEATDIAQRAADNVKRVIRNDGELSLQAVTDMMEMKTVWHPIGS